MIERYLVLDSDPEDDGLRWNLDRSLRALLPDVGFEHRYREGKPGGIQRDVWEATDTAAILSLVADHRTPSHYVLVESKTEELADRVARELETVLPVIPLERLQELAEEGEDPSALVRMAQGADPVRLDDKSASIIEKAFDDDEALVRYRAAQAAGLAPRSQFHASLERMATTDEDSSVRKMAEIAARASAGAPS